MSILVLFLESETLKRLNSIEGEVLSDLKSYLESLITLPLREGEGGRERERERERERDEEEEEGERK